MSIYQQTSASDHFWELTLTVPEPELDWQWTKNFILHKKLVSKHWLTSISLLLDTKVHEAEATLNWKLENVLKILVDTYRTYGDELIRMIHHGNE